MQLHPYLTAQFAAEHVKDMRAQAAEAWHPQVARHAWHAAAELRALAVRGRLGAAGRMRLRQDVGHGNAGGLRRDEQLRTSAAMTGRQRLTEPGLATAGEREATCCYVTGDKLWVRGTPAVSAASPAPFPPAAQPGLHRVCRP